MDMLVYTRQKTLEHKLEGDYAYCWWDLSVQPKNVVTFDDSDDRIYFATNKAIKGYFEIEEALGGRITFNPSTWVELKNPIPHKPFQGFKYLTKRPEEVI